MPLYAFYCQPCKTVYQFYSPLPEAERIPSCPGCGKKSMTAWRPSLPQAGMSAQVEDQGGTAVDEQSLCDAFTRLVTEAAQGRQGLAAMVRDFAITSTLPLTETAQTGLTDIVKEEDLEAGEKAAERFEEQFVSAVVSHEQGSSRDTHLQQLYYDPQLYHL